MGRLCRNERLLPLYIMHFEGASHKHHHHHHLSHDAVSPHCPVLDCLSVWRVCSVSGFSILLLITRLTPVRTPVPDGWTLCRHPNGDIYFYNADLQVITPEDIRDPDMLEQITNARDENVASLEEHPIWRTLPDDLVQIIFGPTDEEVGIAMFSESARTSYTWDSSGTGK